MRYLDLVWIQELGQEIEHWQFWTENSPLLMISSHKFQRKHYVLVVMHENPRDEEVWEVLGVDGACDEAYFSEGGNTGGERVVMIGGKRKGREETGEVT